MSMHYWNFHNVYQRRMLKVADKIEHLKPDEFDVSRWLTPTGAPSCIASWTFAMFHGKPNHERDIAGIASMLLGLDSDKARKLFTPRCSDIYPERPEGRDGDYENDFARHDITREWAAATLRYLAATGEVDWVRNRPAPDRIRRDVPPLTARITEFITS